MNQQILGLSICWHYNNYDLLVGEQLTYICLLISNAILYLTSELAPLHFSFRNKKTTVVLQFKTIRFSKFYKSLRNVKMKVWRANIYSTKCTVQLFRKLPTVQITQKQKVISLRRKAEVTTTEVVKDVTQIPINVLTFPAFPSGCICPPSTEIFLPFPPSSFSTSPFFHRIRAFLYSGRIHIH